MAVKDGKVHDRSGAGVGFQLHCPVKVLIVGATAENVGVADVFDVNLRYRLAALDALLQQQAKVNSVVPEGGGKGREREALSALVQTTAKNKNKQ